MDVLGCLATCSFVEARKLLRHLRSLACICGLQNKRPQRLITAECFPYHVSHVGAVGMKAQSYQKHSKIVVGKQVLGTQVPSPDWRSRPSSCCTSCPVISQPGLVLGQVCAANSEGTQMLLLCVVNGGPCGGCNTLPLSISTRRRFLADRFGHCDRMMVKKTLPQFPAFT